MVNHPSRNKAKLEAAELAQALEDLIAASQHMSPFGSDRSVQSVRKAGKYMEALERAQALLAKVRR